MPKVKTAFITGASRGIGRAIAKKFAESGIKVTCTSRTVKDLEKIVSEIEEKRRNRIGCTYRCFGNDRL